ncbi:hypothetical protein IFM89_000894 [Coptis chinensis]|uniref:Uncharacterized protein n=1 Tax=Coptis chinensis TaxID=261450 RepID=A0A835IJJ5_9MAGN|nr:hypothetical protein IFM89_000894 [Coptis chinensis]
MDDSGAILCQISTLKDMLDQVNQEIEEHIQITREIESEVANCSEIENGLALRESELMKMKCVAEFEINGLIQVSGIGRNSVEVLDKELNCLREKRDGALNRITHKREAFILRCSEFQRNISKGENEQVWKLLLEKEVLENDNYKLNMKVSSLTNSMSAFVEEILEELHTCNSALHAEIRRENLENKKLLEDIEDLKTSLIATSTFENHPRYVVCVLYFFKSGCSNPMQALEDYFAIKIWLLSRILTLFHCSL